MILSCSCGRKMNHRLNKTVKEDTPVILVLIIGIEIQYLVFLYEHLTNHEQ
jgi:hypothetical protein